MEMLRIRTKSEEEYNKRIKDYYESEKFLEQSTETFDLIFTNSYDEKSIQKLLELMENQYFNRIEHHDWEISTDIKRLLKEDICIDHKLALATGLISQCKSKDKEDSNVER